MMFRKLMMLVLAVTSATLATASARAASTDVVHLTVQGRITDLVDEPIPDGSYTAGFEVHAQDGTTHFIQKDINTIDGRYSTTLNDIPISIFECDDAGSPCVQELTLTIEFFSWLADGIEINQSGRAAVTARVNGDIETAPSQIIVPPNIPGVYPLRNLTIASTGVTANAADGTPAFQFSTEYNPLPSFSTNLTSTFNAPTTINNRFMARYDGVDDDFGIDQFGFARIGQPWEFDWNDDGFTEFRQTVNGEMTLNPNSDAVDEFRIYDEEEPTLALKLKNIFIDRNNDGNPDATFSQSGAVSFNTDFMGGDDVNFGPGGATINNALTVGSGAINPRLGSDNLGFLVNFDGDIRTNIEARPDSFKVDVDDDGAPEVRISSPSATYFKGSVHIDHEGDGFNDVFLTTGETILKTTLVVDAGSDGTAELNVTSSGVTITGDLTVTGNKSFVQSHPTDPSREIVYIALEGGESGTYARGSARLENGAAVIALPDHFTLVTGSDGLTAQITPRGPVRSMLYVEAITPERLVVKASNPADSGVLFDYMVNGVRLGHEDHQPIRFKETLATSR